MQPCKTGDQPYSDASPNGECSLDDLTKAFRRAIEIPQLLALTFGCWFVYKKY